MGRERSDEEGLGPLERGRSRYQRKDYEGALSAFSEVSVLPLKRKLIHMHSIVQTPPCFGKFRGYAEVDWKQAVKISEESLLLTALDHRAAAYEKLNQLQSALRDAKQMLEVKPDRAKVGDYLHG